MLYSDYGTKELYLSLLLLSVWQDSPLCCSALSGSGSVESHEVVVSTQQQDICSPGNIMELGHSTNSFPKTTQYAPTALVQLSHRMFGASKNVAREAHTFHGDRSLLLVYDLNTAAALAVRIES
jgi:hypothetical protein